MDCNLRVIKLDKLERKFITTSRFLIKHMDTTLRLCMWMNIIQLISSIIVELISWHSISSHWLVCGVNRKWKSNQFFCCCCWSVIFSIFFSRHLIGKKLRRNYCVCACVCLVYETSCHHLKNQITSHFFWIIRKSSTKCKCWNSTQKTM